MSAAAWLHRKGIARMLNSGSNSMNDRGTAYIEARGPRRIAARLAMYALCHTVIATPDRQTIRITKTEQCARYHWRFQVAFRRLSR